VEVLVFGLRLGTLRRSRCLPGKRGNDEFEIRITVKYNEGTLICEKKLKTIIFHVVGSLICDP